MTESWSSCGNGEAAPFPPAHRGRPTPGTSLLAYAELPAGHAAPRGHRRETKRVLGTHSGQDASLALCEGLCPLQRVLTFLSPSRCLESH